MKLKLPQKVALSFALLLFLMAITMVTSFFTQDADSKDIALFHNETVKQSMVSQVQMHFTALAAAVNSYTLTGKAEHRKQYAKEKDSLHKYLERLNALALSAEERASLDSLADDIKTIEELSETVFEKNSAVRGRKDADTVGEIDTKYVEDVSLQLADFDEATE